VVLGSAMVLPTAVHLINTCQLVIESSTAVMYSIHRTESGLSSNLEIIASYSDMLDGPGVAEVERT
jgi:hypothetical protein